MTVYELWFRRDGTEGDEWAVFTSNPKQTEIMTSGGHQVLGSVEADSMQEAQAVFVERVTAFRLATAPWRDGSPGASEA